MIMLAGLMVILILSPAVAAAQSKVGTTAAQFLSIGMGARATAMGGTFTAVSDDITGLYWNPAGLARLGANEAGFVHTNWLIGTSIDWAGIGIKAGNYGTFGAAVTLLGSGDILRTTEIDPDGTTGETFSTSDFAVGLSYARAITDRFSVGITLKYVSQRLYNVSATTAAADFGVLFKTSENGLRIAAVISNFGGSLKLSGKDLLVTATTGTGQAGENNQIAAELTTDTWNLPTSFRIGLAYDALRLPDGRLTLAADAMSPTDNRESINLGAEYAWRDLLYLRAGYNGLLRSDSETSWTAGAGLRYNFSGIGFSFDYTYQAFGRLSAPQWLAVGMRF